MLGIIQFMGVVALLIFGVEQCNRKPEPKKQKQTECHERAGGGE